MFCDDIGVGHLGVLHADSLQDQALPKACDGTVPGDLAQADVEG